MNNMNDRLEAIANEANDRLLNFALEFDCEYGWLAGFKNGDQWVGVVSDWGAGAHEAIAGFEEKLRSEH